MVSPPSQNTVGVCNQITFLILYYISSRTVTLLTDVPIQVSDVNDLTVSFKFINFSFQVSFFLSLKCLLASRLALFRLSTWFWLGSCNHCILACLLWSKKPKYFSSNHGLGCFNDCRPRLSLAEVLIFSLVFSRAQLMS